jgi:biotin-(acetyl-CoA carboxylase) ligase
MSILIRFRELTGRFEIEDGGFVPRLWQRRWLHKDHRIRRDGVEGIAIGVDDDGALLVETPDGSRVKISSGQVCIQSPRPAKKVFNKDLPCSERS